MERCQILLIDKDYQVLIFLDTRVVSETTEFAFAKCEPLQPFRSLAGDLLQDGTASAAGKQARFLQTSGATGGPYAAKT